MGAPVTLNNPGKNKWEMVDTPPTTDSAFKKYLSEGNPTSGTVEMDLEIDPYFHSGDINRITGNYSYLHDRDNTGLNYRYEDFHHLELS